MVSTLGHRSSWALTVWLGAGRPSPVSRVIPGTLTQEQAMELKLSHKTHHRFWHNTQTDTHSSVFLVSWFFSKQNETTSFTPTLLCFPTLLNFSETHIKIHSDFFLTTRLPWTSLVVQWLRICLPVQGTWVWYLVWEDSTCHGAAGPVTQLLSPSSRARAPQQKRPPQWETCVAQRESPFSSWRSSTANTHTHTN